MVSRDLDSRSSCTTASLALSMKIKMLSSLVCEFLKIIISII